MTTIEAYVPANREQWDRFVLSNPDAGVNYLSASLALAAKHEHAKNHSVLLLEENKEILGVMPILEISHRQSRIFTVRLLMCAAPLFRPSLRAVESTSALATMIQYLRELASRHHSDRIVITYPGSLGGQLAIERYGYLPVKEFGFAELNLVGLFLNLSPDEDSLFRNLDGKCRNMIRRSQKSDAHAFTITQRDAWLSCYEMNVQTLGLNCYSIEEMELIWDEFIVNNFAFAVAVEMERRIQAVAVLSYLNRGAYYWLGFGAHPRLLPGASNFALWEAILECKRRGIHWLNLGSLDFSSNAKQRGIASFKESFGGTPAYTLGGKLEIRPTKTLILSAIEKSIAKLRGVRSRPEPNPKSPA